LLDLFHGLLLLGVAHLRAATFFLVVVSCLRTVFSTS
jgi:hypothetical protein